MTIDWTLNVPTLFGGASALIAAWRFSLTVSRAIDRVKSHDERLDACDHGIANNARWNRRQDRAIVRLETELKLTPMDMG